MHEGLRVACTPKMHNTHAHMLTACRLLQRVDNYEYELPSDFEDEEIDEDMAFTGEEHAVLRKAEWWSLGCYWQAHSQRRWSTL